MTLDNRATAFLQDHPKGYGVSVVSTPTPSLANGDAQGYPDTGMVGRRLGAYRVATVVVPSPDALRWCVVVFWGQAEVSGTRELTRQGYEAYLPMVAIRRRDPVIATRWLTLRVPLLPGYGFLHMTQTESREPIEATRGVRGILRRPDGRLACARDTEIEKLVLGDVERMELPKTSGDVLKVGTPVRVEDGPFASFPGIVKECDGVKTLVSVEMFGRQQPIWLDRASVTEIK